MVGLGDEFHGGVLAFPGHRASKRQNRANALEQIAVPMLFQSSPTAFNRVVFAVIRGVIRQHQGDACLGSELHQTRQKLSAATVALGSIVEIEEKRPDLWEPGFVGLPPLMKNVRQAIAGHLGSHGIQRQFIVLGEQHSHGRYHRFGMKVMVSGVDFHTVLALTAIRSDLDRCLGIHAQTKRRFLGIGGNIDLAQLVKNSVGLGNLFLGRLFCTVFGW